MKKLQQLSTLILLTILISACSVSEKNQQTAKNETKPVQQEKPKEMTKVKFEVSINDKIDTFVVELYNETPLHRDNFIKLVNEKYYEGVLFHRVIKNFMIQGGDPDSKNARPNQQLGNGGPNYTIPAEFNPTLFHKKGALAAARTGDNENPQKASSGSQFYIVHGKTFSAQDLMAFSQRTGHYWTPEQTSTYETIGGAPHLDGNYTVFGEVISGLEIVDLIANQPTNPGDRPKKDIKIISATILK
jgi:cyclophilin family peptidyl-prolyl cis-trans isomerase